MSLTWNHCWNSSMIKIFRERKQTNGFFPLTLNTKLNKGKFFFSVTVFWLQMTTELNLSLAQKELVDSKDQHYLQAWLASGIQSHGNSLSFSSFLSSIWLHCQIDAVQVKHQVAPGNCQFMCSLEASMPERKIKSMCFSRYLQWKFQHGPYNDIWTS